MGRTMADKVWEAHLVHREQGQPDIVYIDLHLMHEMTSPQAFDGLRSAGRRVRRPELTVATEDHNVPTTGDADASDWGAVGKIADPVSRRQLAALRNNCHEFGILLFPMGHADQGILHVIGPQIGLTLPGMTIVCGDSHTSTHGALGALAFGIGTSEVEHVLATQVLPLRPFKNMAVTVEGALSPGVTAKDVILAVIAQLGTNGAQGSVIEYRGSTIQALSMEARMTICNMSIEAGARAGMIAPDTITLEYLKGRPYAPSDEQWADACAYWEKLRTDHDATFDEEFFVDAVTLRPFVTWGTNPGQATTIDGVVPDLDSVTDPAARDAMSRALEYMGLSPGTKMRDVQINAVFLGSCTNGRIEDLRAAAAVLHDRKVAKGVRMLVVPGSMQVKRQAEKEGLDQVFVAAGAEWRSAGCSMCIGVNPDRMIAGERSASTTNRNFEGRQGAGARTHLVSPSVAAATAIAGRLAAPSDLADFL
ncbi:MAG: 3-isopropylmalate dehydratase large subunit [Streptosporangiaceae bacterium]